jgi:hypothetical protein
MRSLVTKSMMTRLVGVVFLIFSAGCGSHYSVGYKLDGEYGPRMKVTVTGRPADLTVVLMTPSKEPISGGISAEEMRRASVGTEGVGEASLPMNNPQPGTYLLAVKTSKPDKVVFTKEILFSPPTLRIEECKMKIEPTNQKPLTITGISLVIAKEGDLPVEFSGLRVEGCNRVGTYIGDNKYVVGPRSTLGIRLSIAPTQEMLRKSPWMLPPLEAFFLPGDTFTIKGKLLYFQKEVTFTPDMFVESGHTNNSNIPQPPGGAGQGWQ